jgi:hypothetical protein
MTRFREYHPAEFFGVPARVPNRLRRLGNL